ncbi:MAG: hypothetical protein AB2417_01580 [Clostridiaceae bacterium]
MGYISIDGGGYADWGGRPALNLIIRDYSPDIVRCFGYVDGETNASWAFDTEGYYSSLYKGCNQVITSRNGGYTFTVGATYKIEVKAYYKSSGTYYVSAWSNTIYVTISKPKCPPPQIVAITQDNNYVWCQAMPPSQEFDVYVMYRVNNQGAWRGGALVPKSEVSIGDWIYFAVCTERDGYDDSDFIYPNPIKVLGRPSNFTGFNMSSGDAMNYRVVGDKTVYAYPVTATEWKSFCNKVNDFREWKTWGRKTFYIPSRDDDFTAVIYNSVASAINEIARDGDIIPFVGNDTYINAYHFVRMKETLNSII